MGVVAVAEMTRLRDCYRARLMALPDEELRRRDYALAALPGSDVLRRLVAAEQTRRRGGADEV